MRGTHKHCKTFIHSAMVQKMLCHVWTTSFLGIVFYLSTLDYHGLLRVIYCIVQKHCTLGNVKLCSTCPKLTYRRFQTLDMNRTEQGENRRTTSLHCIRPPGCSILPFNWFNTGNHQYSSGEIGKIRKRRESQLKRKNEDTRKRAFEWNMAHIISFCSPDRAVCHGQEGAREKWAKWSDHFLCLSKWLNRY